MAPIDSSLLYTPSEPDPNEYLKSMMGGGMNFPSIQQPDSSPDTSSPQFNALDNTASDLDQFHGKVQDSFKSAMQGHEDASITHADKAQEYLRKALNAGNGVSNSDATQAGLMSVIPAIAGALGGAIIGKPKLSPHARFTVDELNKSPTGIAGGLEMGAQGGELASQQYLKALQDQANKQADVNKFMAAQELKQSDSEQSAANQDELGGLNKEAQSELQTQGNQQIKERELAVEAAKHPNDSGLQKTQQALVDQLTKQMGDKFTDQDRANAAASIFGQRTPDESLKAFNANLKVIERVQGKPPEPKKLDPLGDAPLMSLAGLDSLSKGLEKGLAGFQNLTKDDPSLLEKSFKALPLGSDLYNQLSILKAQGAQAAKRLEGRVNDTTLGLYTNLVNSIDTEPVGATAKRIRMFIDSLHDDVNNQLQFAKKGGKDIAQLDSYGSSPTMTSETTNIMNADPAYQAFLQQARAARGLQ